MKSFLKTALITGSAFGILNVPVGVIVGIAPGLSGGVLFGLIAGVAFGLIMASFKAIQRRRFARARSEFTLEELLHDGPANHFLNREAVGGWLFLTRKRLLFRPHPFNVKSHELSVPLAEIAEVQPVRTAGIIPNGLRVVTHSGTDDRFVVEARRKWCDEILKAQRLT